jgi:hypothetical protein
LPRFVVLSVVVLKAQAVPRRQRRPVLADLSFLATRTYAKDALERAITAAFGVLGLKILFQAL